MSKTNKYQEIYKQIESLVSDETDQIANMANTAALLHEAFGFWILTARNFQHSMRWTRSGLRRLFVC